MPSARTIIWSAFAKCANLRTVEFGVALQSLGGFTFFWCGKLKRIALPILSENMFGVAVFTGCSQLTTVHLVGGVHNIIASLHMDSWGNEMNNEINRINEVLPTTDSVKKDDVVEEWMRTVIRKLNHYKAEHLTLMKEATTLLELALLKNKIDCNEGGLLEREGARTTRSQWKRARKEICVTSGADVVIMNVLPFLKLPE